MPLDTEDSEGRDSARTALYLEDVLILWAVAALFVLAVFFRDRWWGQAGLVAVLVVMVAVFIFRFRRTHRAFTGRR